MSEVLRGTPDQLAAWRLQAESLHAIGSLVIVGSFARAAMYESMSWPVPAMSLEQHSPHPPYGVLRLRDFDVVSPLGYIEPLLEHQQTPHPVDTVLHRQLFTHTGGYRFGIPEKNAPVAPEVFAMRIRTLAGANIRTFTIGTQVHLNDIYGGGPLKYRMANERFKRFATEMRQTHPDEFLPDEAYGPLRLFLRHTKDQ